jgi:hypothetical protein
MKNYSSKWKLAKAYKNLFEELSKNEKYECRTVYEHYVIYDSRPLKDKVTVVLRVDVDNGFHLSEPLVNYMNDFGLKASHYFLTHPDSYYDIWKSDIPKKILEMGHEVGLHSDHYYEQLEFGVDGLANLKNDIKKLSNLIGEPIKGMVHHGHPAINAKGASNWELTKELESFELGLEYHDGLKSCYIDPTAEKWRPKCNFRISDFLGLPSSLGWSYLPDYPISKLRKHGKKGEIIHIGFHTLNAFVNYWENWETKYREKLFPKETKKTFWKKKILISFRHLIYLNLIHFCEYFGIRNLIKKILMKK